MSFNRVQLCLRYSLLRNGFANRNYSKEPEKVLGSQTKPNPDDVKYDYIGPPDKLSNLRPIVRAIPPNETRWAKELRERRNEVQEWNQEFWSRHNQRFYEEKELFVKANKDIGIDNISADKMSVFYKNFLDTNWKLHFYYNVSWYLKNFDLLVLASLVNVQSLWNKMKK